ncbi:hypothetical protein ABZ801_34795 [Actinomadura sp. NPDC047616]|uniref:hypothetical protein n=1 Tax=Actinomadura sp. NPDC047616 TaxID=3155914 RepID=UPI0033C8D3FC
MAEAEPPRWVAGLRASRGPCCRVRSWLRWQSLNTGYAQIAGLPPVTGLCPVAAPPVSGWPPGGFG